MEKTKADYDWCDNWVRENKDRLMAEYDELKPYSTDLHGFTKFLYHKTEEAFKTKETLEEGAR